MRKDDSKILTAVFADAQELIEGVKAMLNNGNDELEVLSPIPLPELHDLLPLPPSRVRYFTLFGCVFGAVAGMWFQIMTSLQWPLMTGGKPIVSIPAFLVVGFEVTLLFGALATAVGLMLTARLPRLSKGYYHEGCAQGDYALLVWHEESDYSPIEGLLKEAGAKEVRPAVADA